MGGMRAQGAPTHLNERMHTVVVVVPFITIDDIWLLYFGLLFFRLISTVPLSKWYPSDLSNLTSC